MRRAVVVIAALLFLCGCAAADDQNINPTPAPGTNRATRIRFEPLGASDGNPGERVDRILQDHHGFLWFHTRTALIRFDGYEFVRYEDIPTVRVDSLVRGNVPGYLFEDRSGRLWIEAEVLGKLDPANGKVTSYAPPRGRTLPRIGFANDSGNSSVVSFTKIYSIKDDSAGHLWLGMLDATLRRFDPRTGVFTSYEVDDAITRGKPGGIFGVETDGDGRVWLGTSWGLVAFDPRTGRFTHHPHYWKPNPAMRPDRVFNLAWDPYGKLWVHVPAGVERFDPATGLFDFFSEANFFEMRSDPAGRLWLFDGFPGLRIVDTRTGMMTTLRNHVAVPADHAPVRDWWIDSLAIDCWGSVWADVVDGGALHRFSPSLARFGKHEPEPHVGNSLSIGGVQGFWEGSGGVIWIRQHGPGLDRFDPKEGVFTRSAHSRTNPFSLPDRAVNTMYRDRTGVVWIGTADGVGQFDPATGGYKRFPLSIGTRPIYSFFEDRSGRFWIGDQSDQVFLVDRHTGRAEQVSQVRGGYGIHEDSDGNLWFKYPPGLIKLNARGGARQIALMLRGSDGETEHVNVTDIYEDADGLFWVTADKGLYRFDPKTEKAVRYSRRDGLPSDYVGCVVADDDQNLWLLTEGGLSRFDLKERRFSNYDESDGLQGNTFYSYSCFRSQDGRLYFGGPNGFNAFYPREVIASGSEPPVVFTRMDINGKRAQLDLWGMHRVDLKHNQNGFAFEFAALSFERAQKSLYRFRLEGLEHGWTEVDARHRFARYTDLGPGAYVFRVQASTGAALWGKNEAVMHVVVAPPWLRTWWAESLGALLLAGSLAAAYKLRVRALHRRGQRLAALVAQRTAELAEAKNKAQRAREEESRAREQEHLARNQAEAANKAKSVFLSHMSHELRNPLGAILGVCDLLRDEKSSEQQREYVDLIDRSGMHLLTLINGVLDLTRIEAGKQDVVASAVDVAALASEITEMIRVQANSKNVTLTCSPGADFPPYYGGQRTRARLALHCRSAG